MVSRRRDVANAISPVLAFTKRAAIHQISKVSSSRSSSWCWCNQSNATTSKTHNHTAPTNPPRLSSDRLSSALKVNQTAALTLSRISISIYSLFFFFGQGQVLVAAQLEGVYETSQKVNCHKALGISYSMPMEVGVGCWCGRGRGPASVELSCKISGS